jgi:predicted nucleic acid-binding protein
MKQNRVHHRVFFNASVILAGLASHTGGSGKVLSWVRDGKIQGIISEIIVDEVMRHHSKLGIPASRVREAIDTFSTTRAPSDKTVRGFETIVIDVGDAHVLASSRENHVEFLVTLDQKHLLVLQKHIREFSIVSPKELIEHLA